MKRGFTCFIYFCFLCISCQKEAIKVEPLLEKAEILMEQYPDSSIVLLNRITNIPELKKTLRYEYFLLQVQAKDKCDKDIRSDTLIFKAKDYFVRKNDKNRAALASFYCGRVLQEQQKYDEALQIYFNAENNLKQINNNKLSGLFQGAIGDIYYRQLLPDKAVVHFLQAKDLFHQSKSYKNEIVMHSLTGNCLLMQEKTDSAFVYYYAALALADKHKLRHEQTELSEAIGVACKEIGEWQKAEKLIKKALNFSSDSLEKAQAAYNLALLFKQQNQKDSAVYYIQKSLAFSPDEKDNYLEANIYEAWSDLEKERQNYNVALNLYKRYCNYLVLIFDETRAHAVMNVETKYKCQLAESQEKQRVAEHQKILLFFVLLTVILALSIFVIYKRLLYNKKKVKESKLKIFSLQELARNFEEKELSSRTIILRHFNILKKVAFLEGLLNAKGKKREKQFLQKFNETVYGDNCLNWNLLYEPLNHLNNGFLDKMKNKFPQLDEMEFRICCLITAGFNNTEIAIILNYAESTVSVKRNTIRKKLKIESFGNIGDFLSKNIENTME